jgi:hypothetical protein
MITALLNSGEPADVELAELDGAYHPASAVIDAGNPGDHELLGTYGKERRFFTTVNKLSRRKTNQNRTIGI